MAFSRLVRRSKNRNIIPLKMAVGEKNGLIDFNEYHQVIPLAGKGNSVFNRTPKGSLWTNIRHNRSIFFKRKYRVLTVDIATLLKILNLKYVDYTICDIEGAERYFIEQLCTGRTAERLGRVLIEFHPQIYGHKIKRHLVRQMKKYYKAKEGEKEHIMFTRKE